MRRTRALLIVALAMGIRGGLRAQTYEVIHAFSGTDGAMPFGKLLPVGTDFYGTTDSGGDTSGLCPSGCGTAFRIDSSNMLTTLHAFDSAADGFPPAAGLILATDANFYGTSRIGGALGDGTVFRMDSSGAVSTVHDFDRDTGGWFLQVPVIQADDGQLYGTTVYGHCDDMTDSCSTIFRLTLGGDLTTLYTFSFDEGSIPLSPLLQTSSSDFYGTTSIGGGGNPDACGVGCGTVFHMSGSGTVTTVHAFGRSDGSEPIGALVRDTAGNVYGVTALGGTSSVGTVYRIDALGGFTSLHSFDGTDGSVPHSGLILASDGNFYGTTETGGQFGFGTLYRMDAAGNVVVLHQFDGSSADLPAGSIANTAELTEGSDGKLYGARYQGGDAGFLFRFTPAPPAPLYCPDAFVRRDQMAVFLLKTEHGPAYEPPTCAGIFSDVACPSLFANWIEDLASEGITAGCGGGGFCPLSPITRGQMAVFLLKTEHGSSHTPPPCTGVFPDVPCSLAFAPWIEELASEGITAGLRRRQFLPRQTPSRARRWPSSS